MACFSGIPSFLYSMPENNAALRIIARDLAEKRGFFQVLWRVGWKWWCGWWWRRDLRMWVGNIRLGKEDIFYFFFNLLVCKGKRVGQGLWLVGEKVGSGVFCLWLKGFFLELGLFIG